MQTLAAATVGELSPRPHARVGVRDLLGEVVSEMTSKGRGAVLVEDDGALVGIFTERDLLNRVDYRDPQWSQLRVGELMTPQPMAIRSSDSLSEALHRMTKGHRRHLPVIDEHRRVLGVISIRDVLSYIAERFPEDMVNLPPHPDHES
jgi:CBS domain-containing protein